MKKLIKDKEMYNPWRYEIDAKFETDWPLFPSERSKVNYTLTQMDNPVFDAMQGWVMDMGGSVSLADLMDELEHYLGVHLQTKEAKRELLKASSNNLTNPSPSTTSVSSVSGTGLGRTKTSALKSS